MRGSLDPRRLRHVTDFIDAHLDEDLTIESLAKEACLSPFHFARAFKAATGTAPHRYLTERRIERAKALIAQGKLSLIEIAEECGFSSQAHLTRWFKRSVGATPREYGNSTDARDEAVDARTERHGDVLSITVSGRIDDTTSGDFEKAVRDATTEADRAVILDLGRITFAGNSGLRAILLLVRQLQSQNTRLLLCALTPRDRERLRVTGLEGVLPIHETKAEALASLDG